MKRVLPSLACVAAVSMALPAHAATPPSPPHPSAALTQTCDADKGPDSRRGDAMLGGGIALTVTGGVAVVLVGLPALLLRENARDDAKTATYETRQRYYARRANRRERVAIVSLGIGGAMLLAGIPLIIVGNRLKRGDRAAVAPVVTPTMAGVTAAMKF